MDLDGKLVLVTGAGGGIGRATCKLFEARGAILVAADININLLNETMTSLKDNSDKHMSIVADTSSATDVNNLAAEILRKYDRPPCIIIHTAGILKYMDGILKCTEEIWDKSMQVNLKGTYLINKKFLGLMVEHSIKGSLVNFSSIAANGSVLCPEYSAAKAGIEGLTKAVAKEMAPYGIRVNAVKPGGIDTSMLEGLGKNNVDKMVATTPLKRLGTPEEVAQLCLFLGSDQSSFITGSIYNITGGYVR